MGVVGVELAKAKATLHSLVKWIRGSTDQDAQVPTVRKTRQDGKTKRSRLKLILEDDQA